MNPRASKWTRMFLQWALAPVLLFWSGPVLCQNVELTSRSQVSILTMGPYHEDLYSAFGHSAIRVHDPGLGIDLAFNFGTFDDDQPNFYLNFARGFNLYKLSVQDYPWLVRVYSYFDRYIHEQILDLNQGQKQDVFDFLQHNALPENAGYFYDYFYDNCATRIRDVFEIVLGDSLKFNEAYAPLEMSIRELTDQYLVGRYPWGDLGIDLGLGLPMDKRITPYQYMFLPDYVEMAFDSASLIGSEGVRPIVKERVVVYTSKRPFPDPSLPPPLAVFSILFAIVAFFTWRHNRQMKKGRYLDLCIFPVVGLVGTLLLLLWVATDHKAAANNLNVAWALPTHLIAVVFLMRRNLSNLGSYYFRSVAILMLVLIVTWNFLPQDLHYSLIPLVCILMIRSFYIGWGRAYASINLPNE